MTQAICPVCNNDIAKHKTHCHKIGQYAVYYDNLLMNSYCREELTTSVHDHRSQNSGKTPLLFTLVGLIFLDEKRIETYLLLK